RLRARPAPAPGDEAVARVRVGSGEVRRRLRLRAPLGDAAIDALDLAPQLRGVALDRRRRGFLELRPAPGERLRERGLAGVARGGLHQEAPRLVGRLRRGEVLPELGPRLEPALRRRQEVAAPPLED